MVHFVRKDISTSVRLVVMLVICALFLCIFWITEMSTQAKVSDSASNMRSLLEQLHKDKRQILFQFAIPLVADEVLWDIPDVNVSDEDQVSRSISNIGDDYICFDELAGQANSIRCTPLSNIVSVSYLNQHD